MAKRWVNGKLVEDEIRPPMGAAIDSAGPPKGLYAPGGAVPQGVHPNPPNPNAFDPWQPPPIPSGYFDPALDAQRQSASRGLVNTEQDLGLAGRRAVEDFGFERAGIDRQHLRDRADIFRQRTYADEDYARNVSLLTRQFGQLARQQGEQARKYGVTSGGIALMSAARRAENQALERQALDTGYARATDGLRLAWDRSGEDWQAASDRLTSSYDRGVADRGTALSRARTEDLFYGLDVDAQKAFQAQQAGYVAPERPANQRVLPDGRVVQDVVRDGFVYTYDSSGKLVEKKRKAA